MKDNSRTYAHFIDEATGKNVTRLAVLCVPRVGDEIRIGGSGSERYYKVTRVIWVYDEPDSPYERVNIGVELCA